MNRIVRTLSTLTLNSSIPVKNSVIDVRENHRELITDSKRSRDCVSNHCNLPSGTSRRKESRYAPHRVHYTDRNLREKCKIGWTSCCQGNESTSSAPRFQVLRHGINELIVDPWVNEPPWLPSVPSELVRVREVCRYSMVYTPWR